MSKAIALKSSVLAAFILIAISSCGKAVINSESSGNGSSSGGTASIPPTTPPGGPGGGTITPTPLPTTVSVCPADRIKSFDFVQSNPVQETIDLNGYSSIISVTVGGQEVSYQFDSNAGSVTLSDPGQPGEEIQIEVCLPYPISKPTCKPPIGKPTGKPEPKPI